MLELASFEHLSIGEEQSENRVLALAWSPEGLAKHRRCALAVLTTNLLLHIWASPTDPAKENSWKRVLVVNDTLEAYFQIRPQSQRADQHRPTVRRQKRVRAASWAPRPSTGPDLSVWSSNAALLAILNDASQIVVLKVSYEPLETLETSTTVLAYFQLPQQQQLELNGDLEEVTWSAWTPDSQGANAVITCQQQGMICSVLIRAKQSQEGQAIIEISHHDGQDPAAATGSPALLQNGVHDEAGKHLDEALDDIQRRFSNRHDLMGKFATRTWGSCRWKDFRATLHTLHPSEQIEYTTNANERSQLLFARNAPEQPRRFSWEGETELQSKDQPLLNPFEVLMEEIRKIDLQRHPTDDHEIPDASAERPVETLNAIDAAADNVLEPSVAETPPGVRSVDLEFIYTSICAALLLHPESLLSNRETLLAFDDSLKQVWGINMDLGGIFQLQSLPDFVEEGINKFIEMNGSNPFLKHLVRCQICENLVLWQDACTAECTAGHAFSTSRLASCSSPSADYKQFVAA